MLISWFPKKTSTGTLPAASQMYEVVSELLLHMAAQQGNGPEREANMVQKRCEIRGSGVLGEGGGEEEGTTWEIRPHRKFPQMCTQKI